MSATEDTLPTKRDAVISVPYRDEGNSVCEPIYFVQKIDVCNGRYFPHKTGRCELPSPTVTKTQPSANRFTIISSTILSAGQYCIYFHTTFADYRLCIHQHYQTISGLSQ